MRRRTLARSAVVGLLLTGVLASGGTSTGADGPRPGLPRPPVTGGGWTDVVQGGAAEAKKAKQWARVPMQVTTIYTKIETLPLPPGDPRTAHRRATNFIFLMAERGARSNYGLTAPFSIRTVAFGAIPVTATLRLAQRRGADGLPVPITVTALDDFYSNPTGPDTGVYYDVDVTETLSVEIESLVVDGEDIGLRSGCRTAAPAELVLAGKGYTTGDPGIDENKPWESGVYTPGRGGLLTGTVDVPAFAHCLTRSGEDISALLTATVSGAGNQVTLQVSPAMLNCTPEGPPEVGDYDATALCPEKLPGHVTLPPQQP